MNYEPESEGARIERFFARAPERERMLLARAEELIEARAKKLGVAPRVVVNALFNESDPKPGRQEKETGDIAAMLARRLAERDRTGAGSGEGG